MYRIYIFLVLLNYSVYSLPEWIKQSISQNQNISIHNDASFLTYLNKCSITINDAASSVSKYQKIVKILSNDAIISHSFFSLPATSLDNVSDFSVWILRTDGSEEELDDDVLVSLSLQNSSAYFDDESNILGVLPRIGVGSIIAFEYEIEENGEFSYYQEFVFQNKEPVALSELNVEIPDGWDINFVDFRLDDIIFTKKNNLYHWESKFLDYEATEPLSPPQKYLQRRILINCFDKSNDTKNTFENWDDVRKWTIEYFSNHAQINNYILSFTKELIDGLTSKVDRLNRISSFIQNEIRYVAIEIGKNKWIPRNPEVTLKNRYGDCKDKTKLLIEMLKVAEIEAYPVLIGSQIPIFYDLPSPYQFNHVIAAISVDDIPDYAKKIRVMYEGYLLFDPTSQEISLGQIPPDLYYSGAIIGSDKPTDLFYIDKSSEIDFLKEFNCDVYVDSIGRIESFIQVKFFNTVSSALEYQLNKLSIFEQQQFFEEMFREYIPDCKINDLSSKKNKDTLVVSLSLASKKIAYINNDYIFLDAFFIKLDESPKLKDQERNFPIWLGGPYSLDITINWHFPKSMIPLTTELNITDAILNSSVLYQIKYDQANALAKCQLYSDGTVLSKNEIKNVIEFMSSIKKINDQIIILRRGI